MMNSETMQTVTSAIKVLIADDHPLFREALRRLLETDSAFQVVGEASDGREAIRLVRELEVVSTVVEGYPNGDIAQRFSISVKTVKHHLTNIFDKLGVSNRLELALFAVHHRLESAMFQQQGCDPDRQMRR